MSPQTLPPAPPSRELHRYRLAVTLEVLATDADRARSDAGRIVSQLQHGGISHAWIARRARPVPPPHVTWCDEAACPADQCVHCQRVQS